MGLCASLARLRLPKLAGVSGHPQRPQHPQQPQQLPGSYQAVTPTAGGNITARQLTRRSAANTVSLADGLPAHHPRGSATPTTREEGHPLCSCPHAHARRKAGTRREGRTLLSTQDPRPTNRRRQRGTRGWQPWGALGGISSPRGWGRVGREGVERGTSQHSSH